MNRPSPFPPRGGWRRALPVLAAGIVTLLAGCTAPAYKAAPKNTPGPVVLNLPATEPPFEAIVHTVIIYRGPGSWKQDAYWDEYVVTIANRGDNRVTIDAAELTDFQGQTTTAGRNPWELEKTSRSLADKSFGLARSTVLQLGGGVTVMSAGAGMGAALTAATLSGAGAGAVGAAIGGVLALPAFVGGTIYNNISSRHAIEREFERRLLDLPATLVPGQLVQGSLFFRISPGPQRLTLKCRLDETPHDVVLDLAPIAGMHLQAPPSSEPAAGVPPAHP